MGTLLAILAALCFVEFVHNAIEIWGMRQKVRWLEQSMQGLEHGRWPINIDSKVKTILLHTAILLAGGSMALLSLQVLHLSEKGLLALGIVVLGASYIFTTWKVDQYHTHIGNLITKVKEPRT